MQNNKRKLGMEYEELACEYLQKQGYEILERNFYSRIGEIDIVAKQDGYLVFAEVKFRKNDRKGTPLEAVSLKKQRTISKCALYYMKKNGYADIPVRFDVIGILDNQIQLIQNAFEFQM